QQSYTLEEISQAIWAELVIDNRCILTRSANKSKAKQKICTNLR
ncbi:33146_t:CDS:2, partial [Gigaspora margarita]